MDSLLQDLRIGARALLKQPGSTGLSVLAFGLGIGLCATMFSILFGIYGRGIGVPDSDQLVVLSLNNPSQNIDHPADILIENALLPEAEPGDILVVYGTGAYGYSMANNYNRLMARLYDNILEFITMHYMTANRPEPFWVAARTEARPPARLVENLELWKHVLPGPVDNPGNVLFDYWSYIFCLHAKGYFDDVAFPAPMAKPA